MKYFTYQLLELEDGTLIGPTRPIVPDPTVVSVIEFPPDAITGIFVDGRYYGCANIESLSLIRNFNPIEISKERFEEITSSINIANNNNYFMLNT